MTTVTYDNAPSGWNEALPLGNGHFGGMIHYEDHILTMALNHYEVYYRKLHRYSHRYMEGEGPDFSLQYGRTFEQLKRRALELYRDSAEGPLFLYGDALNEQSMYRKYGKPSGGVSHYPTGEIKLFPSAALEDPDHYDLRLDVEQAEVRLRIEREGRKLTASTIVAEDGDYVLTEIRQTEGSLLSAVELSVPARRYAEMDVSYHARDESIFYYTGSFYPDGEDKERSPPFSFLVMTKAIGATGDIECASDGVRMRLRDAGERLTLLTTVVTEAQATDLLQTALDRMAEAVSRIEAMKANHRAYWSRFWSRSSVALPDKLLQDLWHVNLYALACCNGRGGSMPEQACGLNGLWDIKQPTKWGSMWYWDVNIQAAFWPLYTANHLELAEAFNEGLLAYVGHAERMAERFYGVEGIAGDYPHALYFSIWPWCAQFLWDYYRYGMNEAFLRDKAYPVLRGIARFFEGVLEYDADSGRYGIFPDISPEQGPLTRNSTCTLAAVKYALRIAAEASELLGETYEERDRWKALAERLAPYPSAVSARYGEVMLDSEWAPADLPLRHPSLLMPIYPIGEIDRRSGPELRQRAANTLRYASARMEYGMFQFGWLSCAASRLGDGDAALRLLYEQGIDLSLRCNGLFAEETERWMNYCNITNEPLYHPHMMEASGEIVAAVNEMLLQSYDGVIDVFPAVPQGATAQLGDPAAYDHQTEERMRAYPAWDECAFRGLLAVGGFEVSASRSGGRTDWVSIRSLAGGEAVMRSPFGEGEDIVIMALTATSRERVAPVYRDGCLRFNTARDANYVVYVGSRAEGLRSAWSTRAREGRAALAAGGAPRVHEAHTGRRVFLGKDRDTRHDQLLDHFTFDYYAGNSRVSKLASYRLDFGVKPELLAKDYRQALPRQVHVEGVLGQAFRKVTADSLFTPQTGIGWARTESVEAVDREGPDLLRRDFVGGTDEAVFLVELPRGRYDLLIVSGDAAALSYTELNIQGGPRWTTERALRAGEYAAEIIPITQRKDGCAELRFRSRSGLPWRVNLLVINRNYTYL
ncbi:glycosyl hydrolase family 95 catalytic domain-containing protein [Paenibacillus methanolicus]|uniref:Glycosyl hydrolase family 65 n=1 Tax=Paenibacillus methanolicus TaxID=582686 RepID=A0A5S5C3Q8_9BACL|nr:glycoside hydrolase N-terminal domain-containing protein [Paenibacillus methanolicus]TYP73122.1 glycosyl hydrolase family 65 [Paenibacillus methanolicus]